MWWSCPTSPSQFQSGEGDIEALLNNLAQRCYWRGELQASLEERGLGYLHVGPRTIDAVTAAAATAGGSGSTAVAVATAAAECQVAVDHACISALQNRCDDLDQRWGRPTLPVLL